MKKMACVILLCLLSPPAVLAAPYFNADAIDPTLLTPPLAVKSAEWHAEIESMITLQATADKAEVAKAASERNLTAEMVASAERSLAREKFPAVYALLDRVSDTSKPINDMAKKYWSTKRPYQMDNRIKPLIDPHTNPAYPSGHTTGAYIFAHVLGLIVPKKRDDFRTRAEEIAQHRVLVGMHYPHDIVGGKEMALLIVGALSQNTDFQHDLKVAREQWSAGGIKQ